MILFIRIHLASSLDCVGSDQSGLKGIKEELAVHTSGSVLSTLASRGE